MGSRKRPSAATNPDSDAKGSAAPVGVFLPLALLLGSLFGVPYFLWLRTRGSNGTGPAPQPKRPGEASPPPGPPSGPAAKVW